MTKFLSFIVLIAMAACNGGTPAAPADSAAVSIPDNGKKEITYPYTIAYSSQFEFIDPEKGKMVLELWKDFDNNTLDNVKDKFADTVTVQFPGMKMHAVRDSIISSTKAYRSLFSAVTSIVDVGSVAVGVTVMLVTVLVTMAL